MSIPTNARSLRRTLIVAAIAAFAPLIAACGAAAANNSATSGHLAITCQTITAGAGIDVITAHLTCHVTGASTSDTAFTLQYRVTDDNGKTRLFSSTCSGALHNGAGSCSQTYSAPVPVPLTPGSVSGYTTPSHQALGPLTPVESAATLAPGQHL